MGGGTGLREGKTRIVDWAFGVDGSVIYMD